MKKLLYLVPLFICVSNVSAKSFGSGFAWGSFAGLTSGMIANEARRYQQPYRPSLYVMHEPVVQPNVYVVPQKTPSQAVYYSPEEQPHKRKLVHTCKKESKRAIESKQLELHIIKEQNRKKELALREKELDIQIFKLKQV